MPLHFLIRPLRLTALLVVTLTACTDRNNRETTPQSNCRIERITTTATSSTYTFDEQTTYDYDGAGQLLKKTTTNRTRYIDPQSARLGNRDQTFTTTYAYDAGGFLQNSEYESITNHVEWNGQPATDRYSSAMTYTYVSGRLATYTHRIQVNQKPPLTTTYTYEYSGTGKVTQLRRTNGPNPMSTYTFSGDQLVDYVATSNGTDNRPFVIQNGLVTGYTIPGGLRTTYTYDGQQRLVKMEEFVNDQLQSYFTQTYADGKSGTEAEPLFKGFPTVGEPGSNPGFGRAGLMAGKKQFYINSQTGAEQFYSETTYVNRLNGQGFVLNVEKQDQFKNPQTLPQRVVATTTYAYTGCE